MGNNECGLFGHECEQLVAFSRFSRQVTVTLPFLHSRKYKYDKQG